MYIMLNQTVIWRYMYLLFLPLYNLQVCAVETSSVHFDITDKTGCLATVNFVHKMVNIPLEECVEECAKRIGSCKAVNYRNRFKLCELLDEDVGDLIKNNLKTGPCVFVNMASVSSNFDTVCRCAMLESCDTETHSCSVKECPRMTLVNGEVVGNMYEVGSTLKFHCNEKFVEINNRSTSTCMESGNWSYEPECIVDCGPPPQPLHSTISQGLTIVESVRTYSCIIGFGPDPEEVVMESTCGITGHWSPVSFTCVVDCGSPTLVNHSTISQGSTLVGSVRTYICTPGFAAIPEGAVMETTCDDDNGQWSPVSFTCVVDCGPPPQPLHSTISHGLTIVESIRTYSCIIGFRPDPEEVVMETTCGITGHWSPVSFTCVVDCGAPTLINHSTISQGSTLVGSVRTYICTSGFAAIPEGAVMETTCDDNGQWSPVSFTCVVDCGAPTLVNHSTISQGSTLVGSVRTYVCTSGFAAIPEGAVMETTCGDNGQWSPVSFTCVVDCGLPPVVMNASISSGATIIGSNRTYNCMSGFVTQPINATMEVQCENTGQWSSTSFVCMLPTIGSLCSIDTGCKDTGAECISSVCFCGPLYRYNTSIKDCVQVCDVLTDTFDYFEEKYIYGLNQLGYFPYISRDDCVAWCKNNPECRSIDYFSDGHCYLSTITYNMVLDASNSTITEYYGATTISKRCE